ncbi:hypothetical protein [Companilactobacillus farciminis]|uniref:hypothetical protein n=1 Tax=Companilactobacillus farciminis TaxID=1612 RepID=UPI0012909E63|nr:hypothetical protein [Companilactobacillus farciminis]
MSKKGKNDFLNFCHIFEVKKVCEKNLSAVSTVLQGVESLLKKQAHFGSIPGGIIWCYSK